MAWTKVATKDEIAPGEFKLVTINGEQIVLFNLNNEFFALSHNCPHEGGPIGEGELVGSCVICPWHGWMFDVKTGKSPNRDARIETFEVKVKGNNILVNLSF